MSFLSPFAFLLFTLSVPLVLLYFLKVRRRERRISSLLLWDDALRDREASTFFQRLQWDPLLLLQLFVLLLLTLALARPTLTISGHGRERVVLVMDVSASMKSTDRPPSRFEAARREALQIVNRLGRGAEVMVIEAGVPPRVVVPFTRDRDRITSALRSLDARDLSNQLGEAIRIAKSLTAHDSRSRIHVLTDGAFPPAVLAGADDSKIEWVGVGGNGRNVGITQLAIRKAYFSAYGYQAFVSLVNFSDEPVSLAMNVSLDGQSVSRQPVTLDPRVKRSFAIPFTHGGNGILEVALSVSDALAADNVGYAVIPPVKPVNVLLVSPGNLFLEKVLRTDPQVKLEVKTPDKYSGGMAGADVVVLDNTSPGKVGAGRFVFVNTIPADVPIEILGRLEQPVIVDWDRNHPVMRYVDLSKVAIEEALRLRPLASGRTLVEAIGGPLISLVEERDRKAVVVAFDLFRTDLPLRVAFPLILSNSLRWLHPSGLETGNFQVQAGQPLLLPVEHGVGEATVVSPSGQRLSLQVTRGVLSLGDTSQVGLYRIQTAKGETPLAVNLLNEEESDIAPKPLPGRGERASESREVVPVQLELWPYLVALALLILIVEGVLYWRRQTAGRIELPSISADRWALYGRTALVLVLVIALMRPTIPRWVDRLNVLFLLDLSDSISLAAREQAYQLIGEALPRAREGDQAGLIVFGEEAHLAEPLQPKPSISRPEKPVPGRSTDLASALQLAVSTFPRGQANRIVLLSDGRETKGSALNAAQTAKDHGVDIYYTPLPLTFTQEVVVEQVILPNEVKYGEPFYLRVAAWSQRETQGRLSLFRNGEFLGSQIVNLSAGKNVLTYRQSLEQSGVHVYQAHIEVEGDTVDENNRAIGTVVVRGRPSVLLVEKDRAQAQALSAALRSQHIDVEVAEPDRIPKDAGGFGKYDGVVLSNVSSLKLSRRQMEGIRDYVRDQGGGLMMLGGEESFGLGGYYRTPIEEALPVTMEVKQKLEIPSLAVALVIDRSGSMAMAMKDNDKVNKLEVAKEAAHLVVDLLDERNEVGVLSFDTESIWDGPITSARNKAQLGRAIASIKAGGGTDGYPAVKEAYQALFERPSVLKHVIFLSDGQMTRGDFAGLVQRMAKDKVTVSTVAIGSDADVQLMYDVAKWGKGRFYFTEETFTVPRIFTLETQLASKSTLVEQPFRAVVANPVHEILQDIEWRGAPPLGGYVGTSLKQTGEMLLMTNQEDPLLAVWRYGLGRAAVFTSDAKPKWGILWVRWRDFSKFWAQATRWVLRTNARSDTKATVERRGQDGLVTVEAVDGKGEFINFLDSQLGVVMPDKRRTVVDLQQVAPGRYQGKFPAEQEGVYLVGLAQRKAERMIGSELAGLVVPYAQEFRDLGVNERFLRELSELTGGGVLKEPKDAFLHSRRRSRIPVELWPWLIGLVALALLPEIGLRRIGPSGIVNLFRGLGRGGAGRSE